MPKLKTSSAAKKRFRVNKKGTVKYRQAFARHCLTSKAPARKRQNRGTETLVGQDAKKVTKELFPYGSNI